MKLGSPEERARLLFDQAPNGVFVFDRDLYVVEANARMAAILRATDVEIVGVHLGALRDGRVVDLARRVLDGETVSFEGPYVSTTGQGAEIGISAKMSPLRDGGDIVGGLVVVEDITERRRAEAAVRASEARFRSLIELAPDLIGVIADARFVFVNRAFVQQLGYASAADVVGRRVDEVVSPDDHVALADRRALRRVIGDLLPKQEFRLLRADGGTVIVEVVSIPLEFDGAPALLALGRDVTERRVMQARLLQSDRMASVGTLAAGVAHEINNPLAYAIANLDAIASRALPQLVDRLRAVDEDLGEAAPAYGLVERAQQIATMLELAREGADRVRSIVRDLKTFSRGDDEPAAPLDVARVLDASINMAWNEIRHRARLVRDFAELPPIVANESRVGQVFLNLLVNAAQAIPEGRAAQNTITVRTCVLGEGRVQVEVVDTGAGIPDEVRARVFDPFFTTKPLGVGTGLGLWICQGIVTSMGGEIAIESALGRGTTVRVVLPSRYGAHERASNAAGARPSDPVPSSSVRRARVLLIDDEPALGSSLELALGDDHDVVATTSGREALETLRRDDAFDLILCDLIMPDQTGMDVYDALRKERPHLADRVVFVTGGGFTPRSQDFLQASHRPHLEKPFDVERVRELLGER